MYNRFTQYCRQNLNPAVSDYRYYNSVVLCALDASFSARARYNSVINVLDRFCTWAGNNNIPLVWAPQIDCPPIDQQVTVMQVQTLIQNQTPDNLADIVHNHSRVARRLKSELFIDMMNVFHDYQINTYQDFQTHFDDNEFKESILHLAGVGPATLNYLYMLAGYPDLIKIDIWIRRFAADATGVGNLTDDQICDLFIYAANQLGYTPRHLDHMAWAFRRNKNA